MTSIVIHTRNIYEINLLHGKVYRVFTYNKQDTSDKSQFERVTSSQMQTKS